MKGRSRSGRRTVDFRKRLTSSKKELYSIWQAGWSQQPRRVDPTRVAGAVRAFPVREDVLFEKVKLACALVLALSTPSFAADGPGVTTTEIKISGVLPFS